MTTSSSGSNGGEDGSSAHGGGTLPEALVSGPSATENAPNVIDVDVKQQKSSHEEACEDHPRYSAIPPPSGVSPVHSSGLCMSKLSIPTLASMGHFSHGSASVHESSGTSHSIVVPMRVGVQSGDDVPSGNGTDEVNGGSPLHTASVVSSTQAETSALFLPARLACYDADEYGNGQMVSGLPPSGALPRFTTVSPSRECGSAGDVACLPCSSGVGEEDGSTRVGRGWGEILPSGMKTSGGIALPDASPMRQRDRGAERSSCMDAIWCSSIPFSQHTFPSREFPVAGRCADSSPACLVLNGENGLLESPVVDNSFVGPVSGSYSYSDGERKEEQIHQERDFLSEAQEECDGMKNNKNNNNNIPRRAERCSDPPYCQGGTIDIDAQMLKHDFGGEVQSMRGKGGEALPCSMSCHHREGMHHEKQRLGDGDRVFIHEKTMEFFSPSGSSCSSPAPPLSGATRSQGNTNTNTNKTNVNSDSISSTPPRMTPNETVGSVREEDPDNATKCMEYASRTSTPPIVTFNTCVTYTNEPSHTPPRYTQNTNSSTIVTSSSVEEDHPSTISQRTPHFVPTEPDSPPRRQGVLSFQSSRNNTPLRSSDSGIPRQGEEHPYQQRCSTSSRVAKPIGAATLMSHSFTPTRLEYAVSEVGNNPFPRPPPTPAPATPVIRASSLEDVSVLPQAASPTSMVTHTITSISLPHAAAMHTTCTTTEGPCGTTSSQPIQMPIHPPLPPQNKRNCAGPGTPHRSRGASFMMHRTCGGSQDVGESVSITSPMTVVLQRVEEESDTKPIVATSSRIAPERSAILLNSTPLDHFGMQKAFRGPSRNLDQVPPRILCTGGESSRMEGDVPEMNEVSPERAVGTSHKNTSLEMTAQSPNVETASVSSGSVSTSSRRGPHHLKPVPGASSQQTNIHNTVNAKREEKIVLTQRAHTDLEPTAQQEQDEQNMFSSSTPQFPPSVSPTSSELFASTLRNTRVTTGDHGASSHCQGWVNGVPKATGFRASTYSRVIATPPQSPFSTSSGSPVPSGVLPPTGFIAAAARMGSSSIGCTSDDVPSPTQAILESHTLDGAPSRAFPPMASPLPPPASGRSSRRVTGNNSLTRSFTSGGVGGDSSASPMNPTGSSRNVFSDDMWPSVDEEGIGALDEQASEHSPVGSSQSATTFSLAIVTSASPQPPPQPPTRFHLPHVEYPSRSSSVGTNYSFSPARPPSRPSPSTHHRTRCSLRESSLPSVASGCSPRRGSASRMNSVTSNSHAHARGGAGAPPSLRQSQEIHLPPLGASLTFSPASSVIESMDEPQFLRAQQSNNSSTANRTVLLTTPRHQYMRSPLLSFDKGTQGSALSHPEPALVEDLRSSQSIIYERDRRASQCADSQSLSSLKLPPSIANETPTGSPVAWTETLRPTHGGRKEMNCQVFFPDSNCSTPKIYSVGAISEKKITRQASDDMTNEIANDTGVYSSPRPPASPFPHDKNDAPSEDVTTLSASGKIPMPSEVPLSSPLSSLTHVPVMHQRTQEPFHSPPSLHSETLESRDDKYRSAPIQRQLPSSELVITPHEKNSRTDDLNESFSSVPSTKRNGKTSRPPSHRGRQVLSERPSYKMMEGPDSPPLHPALSDSFTAISPFSSNFPLGEMQLQSDIVKQKDRVRNEEKVDTENSMDPNDVTPCIDSQTKTEAHTENISLPGGVPHGMMRDTYRKKGAEACNASVGDAGHHSESIDEPGGNGDSSMGNTHSVSHPSGVSHHSVDIVIMNPPAIVIEKQLKTSHSSVGDGNLPETKNLASGKKHSGSEDDTIPATNTKEAQIEQNVLSPLFSPTEYQYPDSTPLGCVGTPITDACRRLPSLSDLSTVQETESKDGMRNNSDDEKRNRCWAGGEKGGTRTRKVAPLLAEDVEMGKMARVQQPSGNLRMSCTSPLFSDGHTLASTITSPVFRASPSVPVNKSCSDSASLSSTFISTERMRASSLDLPTRTHRRDGATFFCINAQNSSSHNALLRENQKLCAEDEEKHAAGEKSLIHPSIDSSSESECGSDVMNKDCKSNRDPEVKQGMERHASPPPVEKAKTTPLNDLACVVQACEDSTLKDDERSVLPSPSLSSSAASDPSCCSLEKTVIPSHSTVSPVPTDGRDKPQEKQRFQQEKNSALDRGVERNSDVRTMGFLVPSSATASPDATHMALSVEHDDICTREQDNTITQPGISTHSSIAFDLRSLMNTKKYSAADRSAFTTPTASSRNNSRESSQHSQGTRRPLPRSPPLREQGDTGSVRGMGSLDPESQEPFARIPSKYNLPPTHSFSTSPPSNSTNAGVVLGFSASTSGAFIVDTNIERIRREISATGSDMMTTDRSQNMGYSSSSPPLPTVFLMNGSNTGFPMDDILLSPLTARYHNSVYNISTSTNGGVDGTASFILDEEDSVNVGGGGNSGVPIRSHVSISRHMLLQSLTALNHNNLTFSLSSSSLQQQQPGIAVSASPPTIPVSTAPNTSQSLPRSSQSDYGDGRDEKPLATTPVLGNQRHMEQSPSSAFVHSTTEDEEHPSVSPLATHSIACANATMDVAEKQPDHVSELRTVDYQDSIGVLGGIANCDVPDEGSVAVVSFSVENTEMTLDDDQTGNSGVMENVERHSENVQLNPHMMFPMTYKNVASMQLSDGGVEACGSYTYASEEFQLNDFTLSEGDACLATAQNTGLPTYNSLWPTHDSFAEEDFDTPASPDCIHAPFHCKREHPYEGYRKHSTSNHSGDLDESSYSFASSCEHSRSVCSVDCPTSPPPVCRTGTKKITDVLSVVESGDDYALSCTPRATITQHKRFSGIQHAVLEDECSVKSRRGSDSRRGSTGSSRRRRSSVAVRIGEDGNPFTVCGLDGRCSLQESPPGSATFRRERSVTFLSSPFDASGRTGRQTLTDTCFRPACLDDYGDHLGQQSGTLPLQQSSGGGGSTTAEHREDKDHLGDEVVLDESQQGTPPHIGNGNNNTSKESDDIITNATGNTDANNNNHNNDNRVDKAWTPCEHTKTMPYPGA